MKILLFGICLISLPIFSQVDSTSTELSNGKDSAKWPYIKNYTPPFIGAIVGYNFLQSQELEIGIMYNVAEAEGLGVGGMFGPSILYRRSIDKNFNSIDFDLGFYTLLTFGAGINYNFNKDESIFGFRPFIGLNLYHIQLTYGFNILNHDKNELIGLNKHNLRIRIVIPLKRLRVVE